MAQSGHLLSLFHTLGEILVTVHCETLAKTLAGVRSCWRRVVKQKQLVQDFYISRLDVLYTKMILSSFLFF
jgi:hypothetical protein